MNVPIFCFVQCRVVQKPGPTEGYSVADVLTIGQKDIMENWAAYRERFMKEMKK